MTSTSSIARANGGQPPEEPSRRSRVLAVAAELFATRGFEATTLTDVADASELKKPSLYHYFSSKHSILSAVLDEGIDELLATASEAAAVEDPVERLDALLSAHLHNFEHKLAHVVVFLLERRVMERDLGEFQETESYLKKRRAYDRLFIDCIRDGQEIGGFRDGDPVVLAYALLGMMNWMVQWYDPAGRLSMDSIGALLRACALSAVSPGADKP